MASFTARLNELGAVGEKITVFDLPLDQPVKINKATSSSSKFGGKSVYVSINDNKYFYLPARYARQMTDEDVAELNIGNVFVTYRGSKQFLGKPIAMFEFS